MWRITAVAGLVAVTGIAVFSMQTTTVHACTPPIGDPLAGAPTIIEGRVVGYTAQSAPDPIPPEGYGVSAELVIEIKEVHLGEIAEPTVTVTGSTFVGDAQPLCEYSLELLDGQYVILGLYQQDGATFGIWYLGSAFVAPEPEGEAYEAVIQRIANLFEPVLPPVGTGPASSTTTNHFVVAVAALGAALLAASFAIRFSTGRKT